MLYQAEIPGGFMRRYLLVFAVAGAVLLPTSALADIACVQTKLTEMGFDPGPIDGQLGRRTYAAAAVVAEQAGLVLPALSAATSTDWCASLTAFALTPEAKTIFARSEEAVTALPIENTGFDSFSWIGGPRKPHFYRQVQSPEDGPMEGAFVERFEIRAGDCGMTFDYNDCDHDREHIGWNEESLTPLAEEVWYSFSLMMPDVPDMKEINTILAEFRPDGHGQINLSIEIQKGELVAVVGSTTIEQTNDLEPPPVAEWQSLGRLSPGRWYDFVLEAVWSRDEADGRLILSRGKSIWLDFRGANTAFGRPVHMQYGLYRPYVSGYGGDVPTQIVYFDKVHKASSRELLGTTP